MQHTMTMEPTNRNRIRNALFYAIVAGLAYLSFQVFRPFFAPLTWAIVLVVVFYPIHVRLARKSGPTVAAVASTIGVTLLIIVPTFLVLAAFVRQGLGAGRELQQAISSGRFNFVNQLWAHIQARFPGIVPVDLSTLLASYADRAVNFLAGQLGTVLKNTAIFLFHLSVALLAMFYLFRDGDSIITRLREILPFGEAHRERMLREAHDLVFASVASSLVAAAMHGLLGGLAFAVMGIRAPVFWGVMMGFFSLVPVVGSALVWAPAAVSLMIGGRMASGILLALICGVIVGLVDNFVRPWVISGRAQMGGLVVFISVLGGISVFGMLGVVLGPVIVAAASSFLELRVHDAPAGPTENGKRADVVLE